MGDRTKLWAFERADGVTGLVSQGTAGALRDDWYTSTLSLDTWAFTKTLKMDGIKK
jgi:hypothetical protein